MLEPALPEKFEQRIGGAVTAISLLVSDRHIKCRPVPTPQEVREVGGRKRQRVVEKFHRVAIGMIRFREEPSQPVAYPIHSREKFRSSLPSGLVERGRACRSLTLRMPNGARKLLD